MTIAEFEKQPRGPYRFDRWIWKQTVSTSLGNFSVDFNMLQPEDTNPPDEEMLQRGAELVAYVEAHGEDLLDIVFGHYLLTSEQPDWLEVCGVPRGLDRASVVNYLRDDLRVVVSRHLNWGEPYDSSVFVVPLWEEEHALNLELRDGAIATANDGKFRLESGVLRWIYD